MRSYPPRITRPLTASRSDRQNQINEEEKHIVYIYIATTLIAKLRQWQARAGIGRRVGGVLICCLPQALDGAIRGGG